MKGIWDVFLIGILPLLILNGCLVIIIMISWSLRRFDRSGALLIVAFGNVGAIIGIFTATSRQPVMNVALPALVTFLSGYLGYIFITKDQYRFRSYIPACVICFCFSASFGAFVGAQLRAQDEEAARRYARWQMRFEKVQLPAELLLIQKKIEKDYPALPNIPR
jgi:hypothetical protein